MQSFVYLWITEIQKDLYNPDSESALILLPVTAATNKTEEHLVCLCGQYRWALSNPRRAKLTTYHCDDPTEQLRSQVSW